MTWEQIILLGIEIDRLQGIIKKLSNENETLKRTSQGSGVPSDKVNALLLENDRLRSTAEKLSLEVDTSKIKHGRILELEER
jgi:hypothetical protein